MSERYCSNLGCTNHADGQVKRPQDGTLVWSCEQCAERYGHEMIEPTEVER